MTSHDFRSSTSQQTQVLEAPRCSLLTGRIKRKC